MNWTYPLPEHAKSMPSMARSATAFLAVDGPWEAYTQLAPACRAKLTIQEKHRKKYWLVIPAKAGIQFRRRALDSRLRGNDEGERITLSFRENPQPQTSHLLCLNLAL